MVVSSSSVIETEFGGFPFIDSAFNNQRLLAAVSCARWTRAHGKTNTPTAAQLRAVLQPVEARRIRRLDLELNLPAEELSVEQTAHANQVLRLVHDLIPQWRPLLSIPTNLLRLIHSTAVSASVFAWPQHIFLADRAFTSDAVLAEQLVHEHSHQWLYFLEEIWPLQVSGNGQTYTLPSGTAGRSASELLGAVHVVANLRVLWNALPVNDADRTQRLDHLRQYGAKCLSLLEAARPSFTSEGMALARRLHEEVSTS